MVQQMTDNTPWIVTWVLNDYPDSPSTRTFANQGLAEKFLDFMLRVHSGKAVREEVIELLDQDKLEEALDVSNDWAFQSELYVFDMEAQHVFDKWEDAVPRHNQDALRDFKNGDL